jgi:hypothetical protein
MLKQAALRSMADGEVAIVMPTDFLAKSVERRRAEIEAVMGRFFARPTRLAITVGAVAPEPSSSPDAAVPPPPPASIAAAEAAERQARTARVKDAARNHPNIREAARILDGNVDKIEEL